MRELKSFSLLLAKVSVLLLAVGALGGCSSLSSRFTSSVADPVTEKVSIEVEKEPVGSFEPETFYDLMVAELGGQRKRYDLALGNYLKQAHKTRDVGVAERAYQVSMFIGARQASLDAALFWANLAPEDPKALQASAIELVRDGQLDRAVEQMKQTLSLEGDASFDFLASNAEELSREDRTRLLKTYNTILKEYPDNRSLTLGKAILLQQNGLSEEAMQLCDALLKQDPEYVKALILKGRILNKLGRGDEAEQMLADAIERHPDRPRLRLLFARVLIHENKLALARTQFEELLKQSPYDVEILMSLALIALESDMLDQAENYFKRLLKLGLRKGAAHYYLGRISEKKGELQEAEAHFLDVPPGKEFMRAQISFVQLMLSQNRQKEAREFLDEARNRYPIYAVQMYFLESEILASSGKYDEALTLFNAAVVRHPESVNLLYARAMMQEKLGKVDALEKDLRAIIKLQPDNIAALNALGYTLADRTSRLKEAQALIEKAYALDKEDPAILDSMGWLQYRLGNLEGALKHLQNAYAKFPDHEVAAHLGEVLWVMGRKNDAIALWDAALEKKPESKILRSTRDRLEQQSKQKVDNKVVDSPAVAA